MYIFPSKETITGMQTFPWIGTAISFLLVLLYMTVKLPYDQNLASAERFQLKSLNEKIRSAETKGQISQAMAESLLDEPTLIGQDDIRKDLPFNLLDAYEKAKSTVAIEYLSLKNLEIKAIIHGFLNQSVFLFFLCLFFFYLLSFFLEHIFSSVSFFVMLIVFVIILIFVNVDRTYTWNLPLQHIFPVMVLALWFLILRVGIRSRLTLSLGILPIKGLSGYVSFPTILCPFLLFLGFMIENGLHGTFREPGNVGLIILTSVFFLSLVPFVQRTRIKAESLCDDRVIGSTLNSIDADFKAGELENAKQKLMQLNSQNLSFEQNGRLAELAWEAGMRDLVKSAYNRQLLKFEGTEKEKDQLITKMLLNGMVLPGSHFERLFKKTLERNENSTLRTILPFLKNQSQKTQETLKISLRERVEKAILQSDDVFLDDLKPHLEGMPVFSPVLSKIASYENKKLEGSMYVDNYARSQMIHKLIKVNLLKVKVDFVEMKLSTGSIQKVPWDAFRGVFGTFIHNRQSGVLLVEFKARLYACHFQESNLEESLTGNSFQEVWKLLNEQRPNNVPMTELKDFSTIAEEDLVTACQTFLKKSYE